jgi:hypothetical protein
VLVKGSRVAQLEDVVRAYEAAEGDAGADTGADAG